jgi:hypothetical protein
MVPCCQPQASYLEGMYMENIPHHKDFTQSKPGDVSAFLCHFLDGRCIKPKKVLRPATFDVLALQLSAVC